MHLRLLPLPHRRRWPGLPRSPRCSSASRRSRPRSCACSPSDRAAGSSPRSRTACAASRPSAPGSPRWSRAHPRAYELERRGPPRAGAAGRRGAARRAGLAARRRRAGGPPRGRAVDTVDLPPRTQDLHTPVSAPLFPPQVRTTARRQHTEHPGERGFPGVSVRRGSARGGGSSSPFLWRVTRKESRPRSSRPYRSSAS